VIERATSELEVVAPPEIDIPPAPERLTRPAMPVIGSADVPDDATIPRIEWNRETAERIAPPPATTRGDRDDDYILFTRSMIEPRVLNQEEVERALARNYPPLLRDAGIGGQVEVQLWLDEKGGVVRAEISRTSGYEALDAAALKVVDVMRLSPALNRSQPTRVIVTIPIVFRAR
jgi:TonB family protein